MEVSRYIQQQFDKVSIVRQVKQMRNTAFTLTGLVLLTCGACGPGADTHVEKNKSLIESANGGGRAPQSVAAKPEITPVAAPEVPDDAPSIETDWPIFLGPTGDSKSTEKGILTKWPKEGLKVLWQRELGTGYGIGSVSKGRYYQFDKFDEKARLVCLDAKTGQEIWKYTYASEYQDQYGYDDGPRASPIIDDDRVYLYGVEGMLTCLNAKNGEKIWQIDVNDKFGVIQNFFGVGSTPVIEGDLLIVMVGGSPAEDKELPPGQLDRVSSNKTAIVAFDKRTGEVKYKMGEDLASYASLKLATIGERRWCFAFCREKLIAFDPANGKIDFAYPWRARILESVNAAMPAVWGNHVFISETYGPGSSLLKVKPGAFEVVWNDEDRPREAAMKCHWATPIYHKGYLYGSSGRHTDNAELRCIEAATGKVMWSVPDLTRCSLLYVDGHFVVLGEYGKLMLIKANPQKYELVAETTMRAPAKPEDPGGLQPLLFNHPAWAAPILSHGLLYVRGKDRVACLELIKRP